jgi:hypothetical protein
VGHWIGVGITLVFLAGWCLMIGTFAYQFCKALWQARDGRGGHNFGGPGVGGDSAGL